MVGLRLLGYSPVTPVVRDTGPSWDRTSTLSRASVVRYDAYEGAGGRQSASVAFLDSSRTGIVLSAIQGRDYARVYIKELDQGKAVIALSPEEQEAVERAMAQ